MVMMTSLSSTGVSERVGSKAVNGPQAGQQPPQQQAQTAATPQLVGREFVRQYYTMMGEAPKLVYRFYSNDSVYVFNGGEPVVGQANISDRIESLSLKDCHTKIRAVDAHETVNRGVVVQVIGEISVNAGPSRRFAQTFVLAPQSEKKYYVHNDTFRYLDELFDENAIVHDTDTSPSLTETIAVTTMVRSVGVATVNGAVHDEDLENLEQQPQRVVSPLPAGYPSAMSSQPQQQAPPPLPARSGLSVMNALGRYAAGSSDSSSTGAGVMTFEPSAADWSGGSSVAQQQDQLVGAPTSPPQSQFSQPQPTGLMSSQQQQVVLNNNGGGGLLTPAETVSSLEDQPNRPTSAGKESSTCPSEEPEEPVVAPTSQASWANRVAGSTKKPTAGPGTLVSQGQIIKTSQSPPMPSTAAVVASTVASVPGMAGNMTTPAVSQSSRASPAPSFSGTNGKMFQAVGRYQDGKSLECQIFVSNLPENAKEDELRDYFKNFGQICDLKLHLRAKTQPNRPFPAFAFVTFADVETARRVLTADKSLHRIRGNHALVVEQKRDEPHVRGARGDRDRGMSAGGGPRSGPRGSGRPYRGGGGGGGSRGGNIGSRMFTRNTYNGGGGGGNNNGQFSQSTVPAKS